MKPYPQMNSKELLEALRDRPNLFETEEILKEAYKKNHYLVLEFASKNTFLMETPELSHIILDYVLLKSNGVGKNLLSILLNHSPITIGTYSIPKLADICLNGNILPAVALLAKHTPSNIVVRIINHSSLYHAGLSPFYTTNEQMAAQVTSQSPILTEMMRLLQQGWKWENETAGAILLARIQQTPGDKFITMASACDLSTPIALSLISSLSGNHAQQNKQAIENLSNNENEEVKIAVLIDKFSSTDNNEQLLIALIDHISNGINAQELMWLWQYVKDKMSKDPNFSLNTLFYYEKNGKNLMELFAKNNKSLAIEVMKILVPWVSKASHPDAPHIEEMINLGLYTPALRELTLTIPKGVFDKIGLTPINRQLVEDKCTSEEEDKDEYQKRMKSIFANKETNWYQKHSEAASIIIQEAGWKENIVTSLLASLVLILGGSTVKSVSNKMKLKEEQIIAAMNDPYLMERAKQMSRTKQPQMTKPIGRSMPYVEKETDSFTKGAFDYISKHEGLRLKPYADTKGNMTIGIGHKILPNEDFSKGITKEQALSLFEKDIQKHLEITKGLFPTFDSYPNKVKEALLDGVFRGDHKSNYKTTHLINNNKWTDASQEYLVNQDYNKSKASGSGVHKRMEDNAKIMAQYGKELEPSQYAKL